MAFDIDVEAFVPIVLVDLLVNVEEIGQSSPARVADYDVEAAEFLDGFGDKTLDLGALLDICFDGVETRLGGGSFV